MIQKWALLEWNSLNGWEGIWFKTVIQAKTANGLYISVLLSLKIHTCELNSQGLHWRATSHSKSEDKIHSFSTNSLGSALWPGPVLDTLRV